MQNKLASQPIISDKSIDDDIDIAYGYVNI